MSLEFGSIYDVENASGWVIDTSVAVCLQIAEWTEAFLALPHCPELRVAPSAYGDGENNDEFTKQLDPNNLAFWESAADLYPVLTSVPFAGDSRRKIQDIIKASRRGGGRSLSRADAEGIFLAQQHDFVLVTGDHRQIEIAVQNGVTVIHRGVMLEYLGNARISPVRILCSGLSRLISKSLPNCPCALPPSYRTRLEEIYQRQCSDAPSPI